VESAMPDVTLTTLNKSEARRRKSHLADVSWTRPFASVNEARRGVILVGDFAGGMVLQARQHLPVTVETWGPTIRARLKLVTGSPWR